MGDGDGLMDFLKEIFGVNEGYLCITTISGNKRTENFFEYPEGYGYVQELIDDYAAKPGMNMYFTPVLYESESSQSDVVCKPVIAADLDMVNPELVTPLPDFVVESSKGRFQAYWYRNGNADAYQPMSVNGPVDTDLKLRRIPGTFNWKYHGQSWRVRNVGIDTLESCDKVRKRLDLYGEQFRSLFMGMDRWSLARICARLGASAQDVFLILQASQAEHGFVPGSDEFVGIETLYKEAQDAAAAARVPSLLTDAEIKDRVIDGDSFVTRYVDWVKSCTDSPEQYHVAVGLSILSSLLCPHIRLEASFGEFRPNLWFIILAGTTITRKTTAMRIGMSLLKAVDPDPILTTSGTAEGIISALSDRDGQSSVFYRDEISGLIEEMTKKDYMSGMMESLTKLYDGEEEKRTLRKQTIHVKDPNLLIMSGGIKSRMIELLNIKHVNSGFLPRFLIVCGWSGIEDMEPIGPPSSQTTDVREGLITYLEGLKERFSRKNGESTTRSILAVTGGRPKMHKMRATPEAWDRMRKLEVDVRDLGLASDNPDVFGPIYERMMNNVIKVGILLAADRAYRFESELVLELEDLVHAISFADVWMESVFEIAHGIDEKPSEEEVRLQKIEKAIIKSPNGLSRSELMQRFRLMKRQMDDIEATLIQRGTVITSKVDKAQVYRSSGGEAV